MSEEPAPRGSVSIRTRVGVAIAAATTVMATTATTHSLDEHAASCGLSGYRDRGRTTWSSIGPCSFDQLRGAESIWSLALVGRHR